MAERGKHSSGARNLDLGVEETRTGEASGDPSRGSFIHTSPRSDSADVLLEAINENPGESADILPTLSQGGRLFPKRLISIVTPDDKVKPIVETIIEINTPGEPGDGKIFVMPVDDVIRVRTGEAGDAAVDEMSGE